ncbi:pilus assembly protein PilM [Chloroflexota bacterium]
MVSRVVTLEIDTTAIRLMETDDGRVVKWASLSLAPAIFKDGVISDHQAVCTAIKQLMDSSGIRAKDVIASVSGLYSVSRIVAIPNPPEEGVITPEAVLEVAGDIMPLSMDELYLSWQNITTTNEGEQHVLVIGIPKDVIDAEMQALKMAGISSRKLDLKTIALARVANKKQALILNIEPSNFDIVIVANGIPETMRTIAWQQNDLTEEDGVEHLAMNLELTVGFYNSNHPDAPLDPTTPFLITGQVSGDLNLIEKLQSRVGYPVESLTPSMECPSHLPVSQYAVNIGLALKGRAPSKRLEENDYVPPDINLLPETYKPWKPSVKQIYFAGAVIAAIALLFPLYQLTAGAMDKTADLQTSYDILNNELQLKQLEIANREPLKKAIGEYDTIVNKGGGFTGDLWVINSEADRLGVQVASLAHEGGSITITCQTEPESHIVFREYITALKESGRFSLVTSPPEAYGYITGGTIELVPKPGG